LRVDARVTAMVPTMSRPRELAACFDSLLAGDIVPAEIVVVDASRDDLTAALVSRVAAANPAIRFVYERTVPGRPAQRNLALTRMAGELLLFLEDDCVYEPAFLKELTRALDEGGADGVGGLITNQPRPSRWVGSLQWLYRQVRYARRSFYQRSGLPTYLYRPVAPAAADVLSGGLCLVRRAALGGFRFDERITYFDDDDLSLALVRGGARLMIWPAARCEHRPAGGGRASLAGRARRLILEQRLLHRRHFPQSFANVAAYYYSALGAAAMAILRLKPRLGWASLLGLWDVIRTGDGRRPERALQTEHLPRPE
jgi:GT2 family glycosyltransferase